MLTALCWLAALSLLEYKKKSRPCLQKEAQLMQWLPLHYRKQLPLCGEGFCGDIPSLHCLSQQIFICPNRLLWMEVLLFVGLFELHFSKKQCTQSTQIKWRVIIVLCWIRSGKPRQDGWSAQESLVHQVTLGSCAALGWRQQKGVWGSSTLLIYSSS